MAQDESVSAHRTGLKVAVIGGAVEATIRPWTMDDRAELKPLLASVIEKLSAEVTSMEPISIASAMLVAEEDLHAIAKKTTELPDGTEWGQLLWEDLPVLVQAIWDTSIVTVAGGGLAGKAMGLLASVLRTVTVAAQAKTAVTARQNGAATNSSPQPTGTRPN